MCNGLTIPHLKLTSVFSTLMMPLACGCSELTATRQSAELFQFHHFAEFVFYYLRSLFFLWFLFKVSLLKYLFYNFSFFSRVLFSFFFLVIFSYYFVSSLYLLFISTPFTFLIRLDSLVCLWCTTFTELYIRMCHLVCHRRFLTHVIAAVARYQLTAAAVSPSHSVTFRAAGIIAAAAIEVMPPTHLDARQQALLSIMRRFLCQPTREAVCKQLVTPQPTCWMSLRFAGNSHARGSAARKLGHCFNLLLLWVLCCCVCRPSSTTMAAIHCNLAKTGSI